ncbi:nucleotidyltransferase domain-containing protein [Ancylothrix sp. C2]|uniref:nucleotidyltransferase domain-containing protein n=1 Tax=Ancylothrix sp. D3o TaxID=2953691 RepID=UPI0021BBAA03|nr:nucleotidyltransferase domain-containing protein [Ancylothrix sp. D3o]MCT7950228.1 nucleotidyltransferase domain-containing protein [Ancylothrix sp. D3o]
MNSIAEKCKNILKNHYGDKLAGVILYGSFARHQARADSDIDLLVLLKQPFDYFKELRMIVDILYIVQLESDYLISAKPASIDEFENGAIQLYRNAKEEGVML